MDLRKLSETIKEFTWKYRKDFTTCRTAEAEPSYVKPGYLVISDTFNNRIFLNQGELDSFVEWYGSVTSKHSSKSKKK